MSNHGQMRLLLVCWLLSLSIGGCVAEAWAQKRGKGVSSTDSTSSEAAGPKRGKGVSAPEEAAPKVVTATIIKEVSVKPNEGALVLFAVAEAKVLLTPVRNNREGKPLPYSLGHDDNTLNLASVTPGSYKLSITHPDYQPFTTTTTIERGKPTAVTPALVSKYGELVVGGAPPGARLLLDGQEPDPAAVKIDEQGRIVISRMPVGDHTLKISKAGYDDWSSRLEVKPGETIPVKATLAPATVTLAVKSKPNAKVYLNDEERGVVQPDGMAAISNLQPGTYKLRLLLEGFETVERSLDLTLNNRKPVEAVELVPIAESGEATENFETGIKKWAPTPTGWKLEKGGIRVSGEQVVLFKDAAEKRPFNVYRDFTLDLDVRFSNAKGAAWIIRAKDLKNYYLFELATSKSESGRKVFNFYICRDGKLELKDSRRVVEEIEKPNDSLHITVEARGDQFSHKIMVGSVPKPEPQPLGTFTDDTFSYGGIGFQAINGIEMLIQNLVIIPEKKK